MYVWSNTVTRSRNIRISLAIVTVWYRFIKPGHIHGDSTVAGDKMYLGLQVPGIILLAFKKNFGIFWHISKYTISNFKEKGTVRAVMTRTDGHEGLEVVFATMRTRLARTQN